MDQQQQATDDHDDDFPVTRQVPERRHTVYLSKHEIFLLISKSKTAKRGSLSQNSKLI
jgi:hypothetical protein